MTTIAGAARSRSFVRHFVEMLLAMAVGMLVLGQLWPLPPALAARADVAALVMATNMSVAMAVWMWHRGHHGVAIREMTVAMYAPFLICLPLWWAGLVDAEIALVGGHVLMLPAMLLAMLRRPAEYGAPAPSVQRVGDATGSGSPHVHVTRTGGLARVLVRWPSVLGLLSTVDNLVDPAPVPVLAMLILPLGYLTIGAVRRTLRPRPVLMAQLGALLGYLLLLGAAVLAGPERGQYLVGLGWILHAGWDFWHHRRNLVVPRPFAEWCAVVDLVIGVSVILLALTA